MPDDVYMPLPTPPAGTIVPPPALPPATVDSAALSGAPMGGGALAPTTPATAETALARTDPVLGADAYANLYRQGQSIYGRQEQLNRQVEQYGRERAAAMEPRIQEYERAVAGRQLPPVPEVRDPGKPPTLADAQKQTWDQAWVSGAMFLGVLAGSLSRRPITNALAAMGGMANGIAEGNKELFESNMKTWEAENKRAIELTNQEQKRYENILKRQDISIEQKKILMQIEGMSWDNKGVQLTAQQKGLEELGHINDGLAHFVSEFERAHKTAGDALQERRAKARLATPEAEHTATAMAKGELQWPSPNQRNMEQYYYQQGLIERAMQIQNDLGITGGSNVYARARSLSTAEGRVLGAAGTNIQLVLSRAGPVLTNAAEAAAAVPLTKFPRINDLYAKAASEIDDPAIKNLQASAEEVANLYAAVNNPRSSAITVSAAQEARHVVGRVNGPAGWNAILENIKRIAERENVVIEELKKPGGRPAPITLQPPRPPATITGAAGTLGTEAAEAAETAIPGAKSYFQDVWDRAKRKGWSLTPLDER